MPEGASDHPLSHHRFILSDHARDLLNYFRNDLPAAQKQIPEIRGLGFWGSQTKDQETPGSDVDMIVFYDGSAFPGAIHFQDGVWRDNFALVDGNPKENERRVKLRYKQITSNDRLRKNIRRHYRHALRQDVAVLDISPRALDSYIYDFVENSLAKDVLNGKQAIDKFPVNDQSYVLFPFLLSLGDTVYEARSHILDSFASKPNGEQYFQVLMKLLHQYERMRTKKHAPIPYEGKLPQTIEEAKKYFLTTSYDSVKVAKK